MILLWKFLDKSYNLFVALEQGEKVAINNRNLNSILLIHFKLIFRMLSAFWLYVDLNTFVSETMLQWLVRIYRYVKARVRFSQRAKKIFGLYIISLLGKRIARDVSSKLQSADMCPRVCIAVLCLHLILCTSVS